MFLRSPASNPNLRQGWDNCAAGTSCRTPALQTLTLLRNYPAFTNLLLLARVVPNTEKAGTGQGRRVPKGKWGTVLFSSFHPATSPPLRPPCTLSAAGGLSAFPAPSLPHIHPPYGGAAGRQFVSNCQAVWEGGIRGARTVKRTVVLSHKGVYNLFLIQRPVPQESGSRREYAGLCWTQGEGGAGGSWAILGKTRRSLL